MTLGWSKNPQNRVLQVTDQWEFVVVSTGIPGGMSCEETFLHYFMRKYDNPPQVICDGSSICSSVKACVITCKNFKAAGANVVHVPYSAELSERVCGDNLLGVCEYLQLIFLPNAKIMIVKMM